MKIGAIFPNLFKNTDRDDPETQKKKKYLFSKFQKLHI